MNQRVTACRAMAWNFLSAAAECEKIKSPLAQYYRSKASMWLRRAAKVMS